MHAHQTLSPTSRAGWLPPRRIRFEPYLEFSRAFTNALEELEARYPARRVFTIHDRAHSLLKRRPR